VQDRAGKEEDVLEIEEYSRPCSLRPRYYFLLGRPAWSIVGVIHEADGQETFSRDWHDAPGTSRQLIDTLSSTRLAATASLPSPLRRRLLSWQALGPNMLDSSSKRCDPSIPDRRARACTSNRYGAGRPGYHAMSPR